jgi:hypothetical protein
MNRRSVMILGSSLLSLALLWCAFAQRRHLTELRARHQRLGSLAEESSQPPAASFTRELDSPGKDERSTGPASASSEVLKLRDRVNQLTRRRDELAGVEIENEQLLAQVAARATNAVTPGYIRQSQAQFVGYGSPEATLQTFLWTVRNKDFTNFFQTMTPEIGEKLRQAQQNQGASPEGFFEGWRALVGLRISHSEQVADDTIEAEAEVSPDLPAQKIVFRRIDGQWKLSLPQGGW